MKAKDCLPLYLLPLPTQYTDAVVRGAEFHRTAKWWLKFGPDEVAMMPLPEYHRTR